MSARRTAPLEWLAPIGIIVVGLIVLLSPQAVDAQCSEGGAPSCCTCHAETHPVASQGEWHEEHARRDCCWYCHGGNTQTQDKELAHVGVVRQPLADAYLSCHSCHPDDYRERAAKFAVVLKVTPGSSEPLTQTVALVTRSKAPPAAPVSAPLAEPPAAADQTGLLTLIAIVGVALAGLLLGRGIRARTSAH